MSLLLTVFITLVVLGGLGLVGATIVIQPMREALVASTSLSIVDKEVAPIGWTLATFPELPRAKLFCVVIRCFFLCCS